MYPTPVQLFDDILTIANAEGKEVTVELDCSCSNESD